jgi:hypothetical protein
MTTHHGETHALVLVNHVGQQLGRRGNTDALFVLEFVLSARDEGEAVASDTDTLNQRQRQKHIPTNRDRDRPALHRKYALPEGAVGRTASHGAQQIGVDLDHLLDCL